METIEDLIAGAPAFASLTPAQLGLIAGCGRLERASAGGFLFREGDPADRFWLIRSGTIRLEVSAPGRGSLPIETLQAPEVVGWSWLFAPYHWQLDARVLEDSALVSFDAACLRGKSDVDHELGYQLMARFAALLVDRLQATRLQLLDVYGHARTPV